MITLLCDKRDLQILTFNFYFLIYKKTIMKQTFTFKRIILALCFLGMLPFVEAEGTCHAQGRVKNAYIWSDYPDPDIIRVGDYYYLVTTTMHLFPGGPIMRSKDLVNWETVSS